MRGMRGVREERENRGESKTARGGRFYVMRSKHRPG